MLFIFKIVVALLLFLSGLAWTWWWAVSSQSGARTLRFRVTVAALGVPLALFGIWLMYHVGVA